MYNLSCTVTGAARIKTVVTTARCCSYQGWQRAFVLSPASTVNLGSFWLWPFSQHHIPSVLTPRPFLGGSFICHNCVLFRFGSAPALLGAFSLGADHVRVIPREQTESIVRQLVKLLCVLG